MPQPAPTICRRERAANTASSGWGEVPLDIIGLYIFDEESKARVTELELLVHEPWRIASRERSSTTREYIGAVSSLAELREGRGAFATEEEFFDYWRSYAFKVPRLVSKALDKLLREHRQTPGEPPGRS